MTGSYAVGLDLGDGESAIAWVHVNRPGEAPHLFHRTTGEVSVVTAYAEGPDDKYLIGEAALRDPEARLVRVNFKNRPKLRGPGRVANPMDAPLFAQLLWLEFENGHPDISRNCVIYVGCPAGWSGDEVNFYQKKLAESLDPCPVEVVAESQSALIYVHEAAGIEPTLRPVLVIDLGSSTTDFTLVDTEAQNLPFGASLGCRDIEVALAQMVVTSIADQGMRERLNQRTLKSLLLWLCRRQKEAAYQGQISDRPKYDTGELNWLLEACWEYLATVDIPDLVEREWQPRLRAELVDVRRYLGDRHPRLVLTTGGGSRMPFVDELCREIFVESEVNPAPDPSLAVAQGLASYGRSRHQISLFHAGVKSLAKRIDDIVAEDARPFAHRFYKIFYSHFTDVLLISVIDDAKLGKDPNELMSTTNLYRRLIAWLDSPEGADDRAQLLGPIERDIEAELLPRAAELCRELDLDADSLEIDIRLPAELGVHAKIAPIDKFVNKFFTSVVAPLLKTRSGRGYVRSVKNIGRLTDKLYASIAAKAYALDSTQVRRLVAAVRDEVESQLAKKAEPVESLLLRRWS